MRTLVHGIAKFLALAGGALLLALVVMTCVSVLGRAGLTVSTMFDWRTLSSLRPVRGDYELIELGSGVAVFAFLPWCHLTGAHARVDLLAGRVPGWVDRALTLLWDVAMLATMVVICWRLWVGMEGKIASGETTFLRQIPVWWAYAGALVGAAGAVIVALWTVAGHPRRWLKPGMAGGGVE